jgi:uncharacterized membrane protein
MVNLVVYIVALQDFSIDYPEENPRDLTVCRYHEEDQFINPYSPYMPVMKLIRLGIIAGLLVTFIITIALYPTLPDLIPSHWNAAGELNGYMSKFWGLFLIPFIMAGFVALLMVIPRIDPKKLNYEKFRGYYDGFILVFVVYLLVIQLQIILWSMGVEISPNLTFPLLFGMLFIYLGFLLEHAEQNWFVGIRTPWTLSSESVWKKTHLLGGKLFKIAGIICLLGVLFQDYAIWIIMVPILLVSCYIVVYSYIEFQKETLATP